MRCRLAGYLKNETTNPGAAIGSRREKFEPEAAKRRKILAHPPAGCMTRERATIFRLLILWKAS